MEKCSCGHYSHDHLDDFQGNQKMLFAPCTLCACETWPLHKTKTQGKLEVVGQ